MASIKAQEPTFAIDRLVAMLSALAIVGLAMWLLIRNEPIADPRLFFTLRVVVSLAAAVLGATIPGFLQISWSTGGFAVRAGGALALFVLTFTYTPDLVTSGDTGPVTINQSSSGSHSPPMINNSGQVTIGNGK